MAEPYDRWHKANPKPGEAECSDHKGKVPSKDHGKGRRWQARYRDDHGIQRKPCFDTKTEAQRFLNKVYADLLDGTYHDANAGKQTFRDFATERIERLRVKNSTKRHYLITLQANVFDGPNRGRNTNGNHDQQLQRLGIGDTPLRKLRKRSTFEDLFAAINLAPSSKAGLWGLVKRILEMAVDDGEIARNPMRGMQRPTATRNKVETWTPEQVRAVTIRLPDHYRLAGVLGACVGGLRIGEILGLSPDDVEWLSTTPHVTIQRQIAVTDAGMVFSLPKGGKTRRVRITTPTRDTLAAYLTARPARRHTLPWERNPRHPYAGEPAHGEPVTAPLFISTHDGGIGRPDTFRNAWGRAVQAANVHQKAGKKSHVLRHTYASALLAAGVPLPEVAAYLGDTIHIVQNYYAHYIPNFETNEGRTWRGLATLDDYLTQPGEQPTADNTPGTARSGS